MRRSVAMMVGLVLVLAAACGGGGDEGTADAADAEDAATSTTAPFDPELASGPDVDEALATQLQDVAHDATLPITFTDAQCYTEVLLLVLGEERTRRAVDGGADRVFEELGELLPVLQGEGDAETAAEVAEMLEPMSQDCRDLLRMDRMLDVDEDDEDEPTAGGAEASPGDAPTGGDAPADDAPAG